MGDTGASTIANYISQYCTTTGNPITYSAVTIGSTYTGDGGITTSNYDVVMLWTNGGQVGTTTMANALSSYASSGGNIVSGVFLWNLAPSGYNFTGTTAFNSTGTQTNPPGTYTVVSATSITTGIGTPLPSSFSNGSPTLVSGAVQLATYTDGANMLAVNTVGNSRRVSINAFPGNIGSNSSPICKIFGNAILYAGGKLDPLPTPTPTQTTTQTVTPTKTTTPTPTNTPNLQGFNYTNFSTTAGTTSVGSTTLTSNILYLTTANTSLVGNVYRTSAIQYNRNFSAQWEFIIGGGTGADGYCVQWTTTNNSTGLAGGGVSRIDNSSTINALSFTTYPSVQNLTWWKNNVSQGQQAGPISWRQTAYYWLDYVHATSTASLYISTTATKPGSPSFTYTGFTFDSTNYYMGFGAGTGGSTDNHELVNWKLTFT